MPATAVVSARSSRTDIPAPPAARKLSDDMRWLDVKNEIWVKNQEMWKREEDRFFGGDLVKKELIRFDWEKVNGAHYKARQSISKYINLGKLSATNITGHVSTKRPLPGAGFSAGSLGDIRPREKIDGPMSRAELIWYNTDGIGQDGKEWPVFWDGVADRAEATGIQWVMVDVPRVDEKLGQILTLADEQAGMRPYLVNYSPLRVTNWWYHNGELQFAVVRPSVDEPFVTTKGDLSMPQLQQRGYYLLVRKGCTILGNDYAQGGWWLWDSVRQPLDSGTWEKTQGRIPMFPVFSESDPGTDDFPAMARSQTAELSQAAIGIMNLISARNFDVWNAAMSKIFVVGLDVKGSKVVQETYNDSQVVAVPAIRHDDGTVTLPQIKDGSTGAVSAEVFEKTLAAEFEEARMLMIERATSDETSSGAKNVASFAEGTSPLLVRRARNRQMAETSALFFLELRWGVTNEPSGFAVYPNNYLLAPLVDAIDAMFDTLRRSAAESVSLTVDLIMQALDERGLMPEDVPRETIRAELKASLMQNQALKVAKASTLGQGLSGLTKPSPNGQPPAAQIPPLAGAAAPPGAAPPAGGRAGA